MLSTIVISRVFRVGAVLMTGSLFGVLLGSGMDQFAAAGLSEANWLTFRDVNTWVFPTIMPWLFYGTLVFVIVACILAKRSARLAFGIAIICCAFAIFITVRVEFPMNHLIGSWIPGSSPTNWTAVRENWLRMHLVRTLAGLGGFIAATIGISNEQYKQPNEG